MIPVLFESNEKVYTSNGIGRLTDCISCLVTEERNGIYECEFTYPITGINYDLIREGNIVVTTHDEQKDRQPFVIYRISRPISGVVTVNAHHVSYYLSNIVISPFSAVSAADAFNNIENNSLTDNPFTFWTDKASAGTMEVTVPTVCKSILGGMKGSILDSFGGGEYEWDKYAVKLYANRGSDNGVTIRYGKNLTDVVAERDVLGIYNAVIPYWSDSENTVVYGGIVVGNGGIFKSATWTDENNVQIKDENGTNIDFDYYIQQVTTMDLSGEFTDPPSVAELETRAQTILNSNQPWIPKDNIKVDFVALWQTEEYANIAPLERVQLCDTVSVYYPELGVNAKTKVIKVVWDALLDRYDSIELGDAQTSFAQVITAETQEQLEDYPNLSMMAQAINHATELISGGLGGHIVFLYDANGKPTDMLVMDTDDVSTAVHVLRINVNGIGFSSNGVSGTYSSAWTLDGQFVADFITAGSLSCNRIHGGTLTLGGLNDGNGILKVYDANGAEITKLNNGGISTKALDVSDYIYVDGGSTSVIKIPYGTGFTRFDNNGFYIKYDANGDSEYYTSTTSGPNGSIFEGNYGCLRSNTKLTSTTSTQCAISGYGYESMYLVGNTSKISTNLTLGSLILKNFNNSKNVYLDCVNELFSISGGLSVSGNFVAYNGTKSRLFTTKDYGDRLLYCYETPSPLFGDMGEGTISEDGTCYVSIDSIFSETIDTSDYQVFLQKYSSGDCYVKERRPGVFIVEGTPGMSFGWELKAKQADFKQLRLERYIEFKSKPNGTDYALEFGKHLDDIKREREVI